MPLPSELGIPSCTKTLILRWWCGFGNLETSEFGNQLEVGYQDHGPVGDLSSYLLLIPRVYSHVPYYHNTHSHDLSKNRAKDYGMKLLKQWFKIIFSLILKSFSLGTWDIEVSVASFLSKVKSKRENQMQSKSLVLKKLISARITWQAEFTLAKVVRRNQDLD